MWLFLKEKTTWLDCFRVQLLWFRYSRRRHWERLC